MIGPGTGVSCAVLLLAAFAVSPARAATLALANGDRLTGEIVERDDERVLLEHPTLGRLEVPVEALAPPAPPDSGAFGIGLLVDWDRQLAVGFSGQEGNSDDQELTVDLRLGFEDDRRRWKILGHYKREEENNRRTENESSLFARRDWLYPGRDWFTFAGGRYERDAAEPWNQRYSAGAGVGYQFVDTDRWSVRGLFGGLLIRTSGGDSDHDLTPEASIGLELLWKLTELQEIEISNTLFPALDDMGVYRNETSAAWRIRPGPVVPWQLEFGIENEYDSDVEKTAKNNDFDYFVKLLWDF